MKVVVKHVLVTTDFSDAAQAALDWAVEIVEANSGSLHVLHVLDAIAGAEPALDIAARTLLERAIEDKAWAQLRELLSQEEQIRLGVELAIESGDPVDEILRYVTEHRIDLVCLGDRVPGQSSERLLGHVAEDVVRKAPCSVLTVRRAPVARAS